MVVFIEGEGIDLRRQRIGIDVGYELFDQFQIRGWKFTYIALADINRRFTADHWFVSNQSQRAVLLW